MSDEAVPDDPISCIITQLECVIRESEELIESLACEVESAKSEDYADAVKRIDVIQRHVTYAKNRAEYGQYLNMDVMKSQKFKMEWTRKCTK